MRKEFAVKEAQTGKAGMERELEFAAVLVLSPPVKEQRKNKSKEPVYEWIHCQTCIHNLQQM
jgi:hypothetical protein